MTASVRVRVNGQERLVPAGTRVGALLDGTDGLAAAIARNREIVPRAEWHATVLAEGDEVEIVRPVQGGAE